MSGIASALRRHRRVGLAWLVAVPVLLASLVLAAAAGAGGAGGTPDPQLLKTYQPVTVFHPAEPLRPTSVQSFLADAELERFTGTSPAQLPLDPFWTVIDPDPEPGDLPQPVAGTFYRLDLEGCEADAPLAGGACYAALWDQGSGGSVVYGRVARTGTRIVLQYWLFYADNPLVLPPTPFGAFWQSHEGDWEVVNVVLGADEEPIEAAYSQHCTGLRKLWPAVEKRPAGSTHPVVYVGLGSHANFYAPGAGPLGLVPIAPACIPPALAAVLPFLPFLQVADQVLDGTAAGAVAGPQEAGGDVTTIHQVDGKAWSTFGGRWGESEYFFTPIPIGPVPAGAIPIGLAPASPALQANWSPATILAWPLAP